MLKTTKSITLNGTSAIHVDEKKHRNTSSINER